MTVQEFYEIAGGGLEEMLATFGSADVVKTFLKIFKRDTNFEKLKNALESGNIEEAFVAVHTLKGVVLNLNLKGLKPFVIDITEALRAKDLAAAMALFPEMESTYTRVSAALDELLK